MPNISDNASAEGAGTNIDVTVNVAEELSLSADASSLNITGNSGEFKKSSTAIHARTNVPYGYTLTMTTTGTDNTLKHADSNLSYNIPSITGDNITESSFPSTGGWGYSLDTTNLKYHAIPSPSTTATLDAPDTKASNNYTFTIGTKLATNTASGSYNNGLLFSLTANPKPLPTMQAFTCSSLASGASTQLQDSRDSKMYWVTKLNDGNCWMTQNLDLGDATGAITLTPDDTDISSNFTLPAATDSWNYVYDAAESYDPGNNYIANGTATSTSDASGLAADATEWHYHQGNYYNWYAATAGSRADQLSKDTVAPHSICPKGWQLPNNAGTKTFLGLGLTTSNVSTTPYFFPRAGYFDDSVYGVGYGGVYWSSTAVGDGDAYYLLFDSDYIDPQYFDYAIGGNSVRCVAR